jgi:putative tryptophan/tyrosine transport system substrate-binding protein
MRRREFITLLGGAASWPRAARAQTERVHRIGVLIGIANDSEGQGRMGVFRKTLESLGWSEGRNLQFDYRWGPRDAAQARVFAQELVELKPDLIFCLSTPVTMAVRDATRTIPVVFVQVTEPVGARVVQSWAKPGGNLTGFTNFEPSMSGKWLELLRTMVPDITRVAYLFNPNTTPALYEQTIKEAAPLLSLTPISAAFHAASEIEPVIERFAREPNGGLLVLPDISTTINRDRIIAATALYRIPAMYTFKFFAVEGGLMSYGIDVAYVFHQAATYVDRILRGTSSADLPVQGPTKLELMINLKTAKALGLDVPPMLLARADEVIE